MPFSIGDHLPDLKVQTQVGEHDLHNYFADSWGILFSHPCDFSPICTTELGEVARLNMEFKSRNVKVMALSCSSVDSHLGWVVDVKAATGFQIDFPIIGDPTLEIAHSLKMVKQEELDAHVVGKSDIPLTVRSVLFISPTQEIKLIMDYPVSCGRNFHEILRVLDSLILTATNENKVFTPVNWVRGQDCLLSNDMTEDEADEKFTSVQKIQLPSKKEYLRVVKDPSV